MRKFLILFLLFVSGYWLSSCRTVYGSLKTVQTTNDSSILKFKPAFGVGRYKAAVNVTGHYLSGLVIIKKMPDSSMRVVFTSEAGPGYFDFAWPAGSGFQILSIIPQLNKKAVITTLRKDFELVLMNRLHQDGFKVKQDDSSRYYIYPRKKGFDTYITNREESVLKAMERSSKKKPVVRAEIRPGKNGIPELIRIRHLQFNFNIELTQLPPNAEE